MSMTMSPDVSIAPLVVKVPVSVGNAPPVNDVLMETGEDWPLACKIWASRKPADLNPVNKINEAPKKMSSDFNCNFIKVVFFNVIKLLVLVLTIEESFLHF